MSAGADSPRLPSPPDPQATWGPVELELNEVAHVHARRLRQVHEAGSNLAARVREAVMTGGLQAERVAEVTGLELDIVRELARPPGTGGGRFTRVDS